MKIHRLLTYSAIISMTAFISGDEALSKRSKQATGYGYVTEKGVFLARVKPIQKMLKGCGLNLANLGIQTWSPNGRLQQSKCNPNKKEQQRFFVIPIRRGENFDVVARTRKAISNDAFGGQQSLAMGLFKGDSTTCYTVVTLKGNKIKQVPVRSGRRDQYLFSNPIAAVGAEREDAQKALQSVNSEISSLENKFQSTQRSLARSNAYNASSNSCSLPRQRALPTKPKTMSSAELDLHSSGQCVQRVSNIWRRNLVIDALAVEDEYALIDGHRAWLKNGGRAPQCAITAASREVTQIGQGLGSVLTFGTETGRRLQIRDAVKRCAAAVYRGCGAPLLDWQRKVRQIRSEPRASLNSCRSNLTELSRVSTSYREKLIEKRKATTRVNNAPAQTVSEVDLANARCTS